MGRRFAHFSKAYHLWLMETSAKDLGFGKDLWSIPTPTIDGLLKIIYIDELLYFWPVVLAKLAILKFYLHIFPSKRFRMITYGTMVTCVLYLVINEFYLAFQCRPASRFWTAWRDPLGGRCININAWIFSITGINIALDTFILLLPMPSILKLHISPRKKFQVISMFAVGILCALHFPCAEKFPGFIADIVPPCQYHHRLHRPTEIDGLVWNRLQCFL